MRSRRLLRLLPVLLAFGLAGALEFDVGSALRTARLVLALNEMMPLGDAVRIASAAGEPCGEALVGESAGRPEGLPAAVAAGPEFRVWIEGTAAVAIRAPAAVSAPRVDALADPSGRVRSRPPLPPPRVA